MDWPISAETFRFVIVIAALVMGWYGVAPALLVAGIVGAFVGAAVLEGTGWRLDAPRAAAAMTAGALVAAVLARLAGLA